MALGRGLSELLGEVETAYGRSTTEDSSKHIVEIDVETIQANPNQPRKIFDEEKLKELSESIQKHGLLQPVTVIEDNKGGYTLVAGERRLRAHKLAGLPTIKAIVTNLEDLQLREFALIENIQRDDLNIIELAYSYAQLINEHNLTHEDLSKRVFKSRTSITNTLRLLQLSSYVQQFLANGKLSAGHAKVMLGLTDDEQKLVADSIIGQKLSVRETEKLIKELKNPTIKEEKKSKKSVKYDLNSLENIIKNLQSDDLKVKVDNKFFKIEITSQEDIEKISKHFGNTL
ncbi:ParB/RepB/Spo0J family partition protein [Candidatus Marinarcus aquaticus]|uniref:Chromosome partitioning protein ParB n=1 Tax=Candidatus Marinarcus aquaticus TaxID=2044504 RepID=A0A4Q0XNR2_9BACT|nr:ParB/RepB/Spo0J family partition protein [Candidatus Marinarcus aquaticus]RXJ54631.1 chromosome partitioning protein ParB [Candidatus Marinarcus aquaticus]